MPDTEGSGTSFPLYRALRESISFCKKKICRLFPFKNDEALVWHVRGEPGRDALHTVPFHVRSIPYGKRHREGGSVFKLHIIPIIRDQAPLHHDPPGGTAAATALQRTIGFP